MNHKHVKTCHYRSLQHDFWEQFSKHELHSGDWVQIAKRWHVFSLFSLFLFVFLFVFFLVFSFFSFFFSWVSRQWDNLHLVFSWENVFWGHFFFSLFVFFPFFFFFFSLVFFFFFFLTKKRKNMKHNEKICLFFEKKRKSCTCCKGVPGAMCCGKLYDSLRFGGILDPSVVSCALSFWIPVCVFSQWSFGPYGQTSSRSRPNDARNESFPCLHVWSGLCIACPYPCWIVLILFWWIDEVRCYTWPKTTLVPDVPFLSAVVRPRGQRCQNKISFDRLQPEQIKQDEVKSFEFHVFLYVYLFLVMYTYFFLCVFISFDVYLCLFISFYFFLFLFISFYFCLLLFISFYFFLFFYLSFLAKTINIWF